MVYVPSRSSQSAIALRETWIEAQEIRALLGQVGQKRTIYLLLSLLLFAFVCFWFFLAMFFCFRLFRLVLFSFCSWGGLLGSCLFLEAEKMAVLKGFSEPWQSKRD